MSEKLNEDKNELNSLPIFSPFVRDIVWYCEACDKEFAQNSAYTIHCSTHESCSYPECTFSGTKKVLNAHFAVAHGQYSGTGFRTVDVEGQKFRVLVGADPEEVQKWREMRRKKFPSAQNVAVKSERKSVMNERGGVVEKDKLATGLTKRGSSIDDCTNKIKIRKTDDQSIHSAERSLDGAVSTFETTKRRKNGKEKSSDKPADRGSGQPVGQSTRARSGRNEGVLHLPKPLDGGERGTLLRNLLADEISSEENIVLQCLRYLVEAEFLQKVAGGSADTGRTSLI